MYWSRRLRLPDLSAPLFGGSIAQSGDRIPVTGIHSHVTIHLMLWSVPSTRLAGAGSHHFGDGAKAQNPKSLRINVRRTLG
jgi:hypothetical protein